MNPTSSPLPRSQPRLTCRVARAWCALFGQTESRHIAACADCREFFRAGDALETALRRAAVQPSRATTADAAALERRILQSLRTSRPPAGAVAARRSRNWNGTWAAGAAAAAIAVTLVVLNRKPDESRAPSYAVSAADAAQIVDTVQSLSDQLMDSVIPTAGAMVANNALQQELNSVYFDMRSALDFLAVNFLPTSNPPPPARSNPTI